MDDLLSYICIVIGIYLVYLGLCMLEFRGRMKKLIISAIPEEEKARSYGRAAGSVLMFMGLEAAVRAELWLISKDVIVYSVSEGIFFACVLLLAYINKKYAGRISLTW